MIERDDELTTIDRCLHAARAGTGAMLLVEGAAGIGKTTLLAAAIARARNEQMLVLAARGDELELSFSYAIVRQLFEAALTAVDGNVRAAWLSGAAAHAAPVVDPLHDAGTEALDSSAVLHGLYWLAANLATERPVALVVDDVQWGDRASIGWLAYLARRLDGLSVAIILGARPSDTGASHAALAGLRATQGLQRLTPAPLSCAAVDTLARAALGPGVEPAFSSACHAVTGGNPFYVAELLRSLRQDRVSPTAASVGAIDGLTPRAVVDATLARLGRLPADARAVAEAIALLEPHADTRWICALTGLDADAVAAGADKLLEAGLLRSVAPCRFEHPILRSAVASEIAPARRGRMHLHASRVLADGHLPVEASCAHLLQTPPAGEPWVVSTLRKGADEAGGHGAYPAAASYLARALAERPAPHLRREVLLALGVAENHARQPAAVEHLREALALASDPEHAAVTAIALGQALFNDGAIDDAYEVLDQVVNATDGHESPAALNLHAYLLALAGPAGRMAETAARAASLEARTPPHSPAAGAVNACLALRELVAANSRARVRERAERAAATICDGAPSGAAVLGGETPGMAFLWIDDLDRAEQLFSEKMAVAARTGRMRSFASCSALRGYTLQRRGRLADAAADIEPILAAVGHDEAPGAAALLAVITQVLLLIDHGQPDAAEALAAFVPVPPAFERQPIVAMLRHAQGCAQLAQRKFAAAAATLAGVGEVCDTNGILSPAMIPWRSTLALTLAGGDRHDEAFELVRTELEHAQRSDVDRACGVALRALGLLEGGPTGLVHLQEAVDALERSPARLEQGWASYELGAALRRGARRRDARAPLDRALDLALACGAELLAERCREELPALGARPRHVMLSGAQSLTPSERRVCGLASDGLKNTEIAQALFVSLKTVETHLRSAFRKLDIASRTELATALSAGAD